MLISEPMIFFFDTTLPPAVTTAVVSPVDTRFAYCASATSDHTFSCVDTHVPASLRADFTPATRGSINFDCGSTSSSAARVIAVARTSLVIISLADGKQTTLTDARGIRLPRDNGSWMIYTPAADSASPRTDPRATPASSPQSDDEDYVRFTLEYDWNTNALATNGVIAVVSTVVPSPVIGAIFVSGNNLGLSGTGGVANAFFILLGTTNLAPANWTPRLTNQFDGTGNFNFTNPLDPNSPQEFYRLQLP